MSIYISIRIHFFTFQLLGELLLDRHNFVVMTKYISNPDNLKLMMNLLRDKSRNIQFEAFHVFKVGNLINWLFTSFEFLYFYNSAWKTEKWFLVRQTLISNWKFLFLSSLFSRVLVVIRTFFTISKIKMLFSTGWSSGNCSVN